MAEKSFLEFNINFDRRYLIFNEFVETPGHKGILYGPVQYYSTLWYFVLYVHLSTKVREERQERESRRANDRERRIYRFVIPETIGELREPRLALSVKATHG